MLTKFTNDMGVIVYNEALLQQILSEAIAPYEGKVRYIGEKEIKISERGLYLGLSLSIRMGASISSALGGIMDLLVRRIKDSLELDIDDIILEVKEMKTARNSVKRDIRLTYNDIKG